MQGRRTALIGIIAVALLALGGATAQGVVLHGKGELAARGNGVAVFEMRGVLGVRALGVLIVEPDLDIEVEGQGRVTELADGRLLYEGFGHARIRSLDRRTRIEIAGAGVELRARGIGRAFLKGCGQVRTRDLDVDWAPDLEIEFQSELAE